MFNFKQFHVFLPVVSSILNRKYLLLHCCCFSGGTFVSETVDWNAKGSPSLAILRRDHAQVLWALAQLPPTQVIHLAPQLFWACWHRCRSDQGADEGIGSAGVRGSEDLRRTSSGCLVSGTCTQALAQALAQSQAQAQTQAVSSQVIAHKVFQPGRRLSLFTFLYISCVHQASFYVSPLFLCLRLSVSLVHCFLFCIYTYVRCFGRAASCFTLFLYLRNYKMEWFLTFSLSSYLSDGMVCTRSPPAAPLTSTADRLL